MHVHMFPILTAMLSVYQVGTIDTKRGTPRVRTQAHRALLSPKGSPNLPVFLTSTDVRSEKVEHILANPAVEVVWWLDGTMEQFRITGRAFIVPAKEHPLHDVSFAWLPKFPAIAQIHVKGAEGSDGVGYDWEKKRVEVFEQSPPGLKATLLVNEQPGSVIASYDLLKKYPTAVPKLDDAKSEEDRSNWHKALSNLALMLIEPIQVERLQLTESPNRITLFTRSGDAAHEWKEEVLVP